MKFWTLQALLTVIILFCVVGLAHSEQFVADFSDKPGMNYGTLTLEAGVWGLAAWGGKALFDKTKEGRKIDFIPSASIFLVTIFWHIPMYFQGPEEFKQAWIQNGFEGGGAWIPVIFNF
jgi:hypothetical protein